MTLVELILVAVGLAMDAFAVSVTKGLSMKKINHVHGAVTAFFFGAFQMAMPILGYFLASSFSSKITSVGHWVAFVLLCFIGIRMIIESRKEEDEVLSGRLDFKELVMLSVATSIDALAVGVTFAFMNVEVFTSSLIIGIITFFISLSGIYIGHAFKARFKSGSEVLGGLILIAIGIKILVEGLMR